MASSSSSPPQMQGEALSNWAELPTDLTSSILLRLGVIEILESAQKVCRSWRRVCKDPSMWRKIVMRERCRNIWTEGFDPEVMCRHAVDRSQGSLAEIEIWYFGTDELLSYIADRSSNLRKLNLVMCPMLTDEGFGKAVVRLPLLEELELSYCELSDESLKVVGLSCPNMKILKLSCHGYMYPREVSDDEALAIAETMPGLSHLQLFGNRLSDTGLNAVLDNCPNLQHLDLRKCFNVNLVGDLEKRCSERINHVRRPNDSTTDYPFDALLYDMDSEEDSEFDSGLEYARDYSDYDSD